MHNPAPVHHDPMPNNGREVGLDPETCGRETKDHELVLADTGRETKVADNGSEDRVERQQGGRQFNFWRHGVRDTGG